MSIEIEIMRAHIKDMLEARGQDVSYIQEHGDAVEATRYYNECIQLDTDKTVVFFALTKEVLKEWKADKAHESADTMLEAYPGKTFILVLTDQPSSVILTKLLSIDKALAVNAHSSLQIFYTKELMYNPLNHTLVPLHEKLTPSEAKDIQESYMIKHKSQMPIISRNDIIARWLGLNTGDIARITRYNDTSGTYYYYRCCV